MKIRKGFISNSSSSSFVVGFPKIPESDEEVHDLMFPIGYITLNVYDEGNIPSIDIARQVWNDIRHQIPNDMNAIKNAGVPTEILSDYEDNPEFIIKKSEEGYNIYDWDKIHKVHQQEAEEFLEKFFLGHPNLIWFVFNYADEDGHFFSTMEHGDIFRYLPSFRISKH